MKILLAIDGSPYSDKATETLKAIRLPPKTEVTVITVVSEHTFLGGLTLDKIRGSSAKKKAQEQIALEMLQHPIQVLSSSKLKPTGLVRWGNAAEEILKVAKESRISLIVMGAKGLTDPLAFRLGSVALTVMKHANASVLLVRQPSRNGRQESPDAESKNISVNRILLATDGSKYSDVITQFLLKLPLPKHCEIIIVTALQSYLAALIRMPTLDLQTNQALLARLQAAEENEASKITAKSEKQFQAKGYKTASVVLRGGAAEAILAAAKKYEADIIAMGSRGLSEIESLLLGSVTERVARHADCSVLIGRPAE
jgi:nucleotide-binding universal stress UspA family protein